MCPANVNDHISHRLLNIDSNSNGGGHGFVDEVYVFSSSVLGTVAHCTFFHFGNARRDANDHAQRGVEQGAALVDHPDHALDHVFRTLEVGNHPVLQGTNGFDVLVGLAVHLLGLTPNGNGFSGGPVLRHNGRLIHHDLVLVIDHRVCGAEINRDLLHEEVEQSHLSQRW